MPLQNSQGHKNKDRETFTDWRRLKKIDDWIQMLSWLDSSIVKKEKKKKTCYGEIGKIQKVCDFDESVVPMSISLSIKNAIVLAWLCKKLTLREAGWKLHGNSVSCLCTSPNLTLFKK